MGLSLVVAAVSVLVLSVAGFGVAREGNGKLTLPSNATLAGCRKSCAGLTFQYPFGVGPGCSRGGDFELICDESTKEHKLFLHDGTTRVRSNVEMTRQSLWSRTYFMGSDSPETTDIEGNSVDISFTRVIPMEPGRSNYSMNWTVPGRTFHFDYAHLRIVGCDLTAQLVDDKSGKLLEKCESFCHDGRTPTESEAAASCDNNGGGVGVGCCEIRSSRYNDSGTFHLIIWREGGGGPGGQRSG